MAQDEVDADYGDMFVNRLVANTVEAEDELKTNAIEELNTGSGITITTGTMTFSGSVGINGVVPTTFPLEVDGRIKATNFVSTSDKRIKKNITKLDDKYSQSVIEKMNIYTYDFIDEKSPQNNIGLIAQEVEEYFPEAVSTSAALIKNINKYLRIEDDLLYIENFKINADILYISYDNKQEYVQIVKRMNGIVQLNKKFNQETIFVFGEYINDFKSIDYTKVSMLSINIIKVLMKQIEDQGNEIKRIKNKISLDDI